MARKKSRRKVSKKSRPWSRVLIWTVCFLALLLALDQLALRLHPTTPLPKELQHGYHEFRSRLLGKPQPPLTIEEIIDTDSTPPVSKPARPAIKNPSPAPVKAAAPKRPQQYRNPVSTPGKYLYVDADGDLEFADRLEDVPPALRSGAQPLRD
jgi:hypothetical protein